MAAARRAIEAAIPAVGLGNLLGYVNAHAVFFVPDDSVTDAAFLELSPRDFENDTALRETRSLPWRRAFLGYAYAGLGRRTEAVARGRRRRRWSPAPRTRCSARS